MPAFLTTAGLRSLPAAMTLVESLLAHEEDELTIVVCCSDHATLEAVRALRIPQVCARPGSGDLIGDAREVMQDIGGHDALVALSPQCWLCAPVGERACRMLDEHPAVGDEFAFACRWQADPNRRVAGGVAVDVSGVRSATPHVIRFGGLRMISPDLIVVDVDVRACMSEDVLARCVAPYASALGRAHAWARSAVVEGAALVSKCVLKPGHTFLAAASLWPTLDKRALPHGCLAIDDVWRAYTTEQVRTATARGTRLRCKPPPVPYAAFAGDVHHPAPRVSALVSTYDAADLIAGCLDDLVQQSLFERGELEIVVVDSCSPGSESEIVQAYVERHPGRIRLLRTSEREGIYMAWNRAARAARGTYLTNANTDDRHRPDALACLAAALDAQPHVGLVYGRSLVTRDVGTDFSSATKTGRLAWPPFDRERLLHGCFIGPHPMWRKAVHAEVGWFDQRYVVAGDYELWLRIAERFPIALVPEDLGLYVLRDDSVENGNRTTCARESIAAREHYARRAGLELRGGRYPSSYLEDFSPSWGTSRGRGAQAARPRQSST